jgi:hypothetical protein
VHDGFGSVEEIAHTPDRLLLSLDGIGPKRLKRIRERVPYAPAPSPTEPLPPTRRDRLAEEVRELRRDMRRVTELLESLQEQAGYANQLAYAQWQLKTGGGLNHTLGSPR